MTVWPGGWTHALPAAFGLNKRTTQRDRIERQGLHPAVLQALGSAASSSDADGIGVLLVALASYADRHGDGGTDPRRALDDAERAAANAPSTSCAGSGAARPCSTAKDTDDNSSSGRIPLTGRG